MNQNVNNYVRKYLPFLGNLGNLGLSLVLNNFQKILETCLDGARSHEVMPLYCANKKLCLKLRQVTFKLNTSKPTKFFSLKIQPFAYNVAVF